MFDWSMGDTTTVAEPRMGGRRAAGIQTVGVVGCGQMGGGIACLCAKAGYDTVVSEIDEEMLQKGMKRIDAGVEKSIARGRLLRRDKEEVHKRLTGTTHVESFCNCDLVIEAVPENMELKKTVFAELDRACPPPSILATDTSCLSVSEIAMATGRPEQVVGMHFFNPAATMTLLELVVTDLSSEKTVQTAKTFGESLGKSVVLAKDETGFIVNRLLVPFLLDAVKLQNEGVATAEDIDTSFVLGCNHPMGPLRLADYVGLDTLCYVADAMYHEYKDSRFAPPLSLKRMVAVGHLGCKTGKGFYEYD